MRTPYSLLCLGFALLLSAGRGAAVTPGTQFHVALAGSDENAGTLEAPFRTLRRAQMAARSQKTPSTVWIHQGTYFIPEPLAFDARDSGAEGTPTVYSAWPNEAVTLSGGRVLPASDLRPVRSSDRGWTQLSAAARTHVKVIDLRPLGLAEVGRLGLRGFELRAAAPAELVLGDRPLRLARWPNVGEPFARTSLAAGRDHELDIGERATRWREAEEIWLHGLWAEDWADYHLPATLLPSSTGVRLETRPPQFGLKNQRPFYVYNVLAELDEAGEYFIDRVGSALYVWLPEGGGGQEGIQLTICAGPLFEISGSQSLRFRNLQLMGSRGQLVEMTAARDVVLEDCGLLAAGRYAIKVAGTKSGLVGCHVADAGEDGVLLEGGVRATLEAGDNFVRDCIIERCGRIGWTYHPAINLRSGCGNVISHNLIQDLPHSAILLAGDRHRIEFNEIRRVCLVTGDAGAIYGGHDWGYRGNEIAFNLIHTVQSLNPGHGVHGVYLDDCLSGVVVRSNIFYEISGTAIFCGGGRDNLIDGNVIAQSGRAHYNDDRGRERINATPGDYWNLLERLNADGISYQSPPRSLAFPRCAAIPSRWEEVQQGLWRNPEHSRFRGNYGWSNSRWIEEYNASGTGVFALYDDMSGNRPDAPPLFGSAEIARRELRPEQIELPDAAAVPVPMKAIGPRLRSAPRETASDGSRYELEKKFRVVADGGKNGRVSVANGELDSGESVCLYDAGDAIAITVSVPVRGDYRLLLRARSGGTTGKTVFWPEGYHVAIDGRRLELQPVRSSVSSLDPAYGGAYWGTLVAEISNLREGEHEIEISTTTDWAVADFIELQPQVRSNGPE